MFQRIGDYISRQVGEGTARSASLTRDLYIQMADIYTISDLMPFDCFDEAQGIFINDHSCGFVLETPPLVGCSEAMQKEVNNLFALTLPEGSSLQTILWADPEMGGVLDQYVGLRKNAPPVFHTLSQQRSEYLEKMSQQKPAIQGSSTQVSSTFGFATPMRNFRSMMAYAIGKSQISTVELVSVKSQIMATLQMLNLPVSTWKPDDLLAFLDSILFPNWHETTTWFGATTWSGATTWPGATKWSEPTTWDPMAKLGDQVRCLEANVRVGADGLDLRGNVVARTYTVTHFPSVWSLHAMGELIGDLERDQAQIPCPFLLHYGVHVPSQHTPKQNIRVKARYIDKQAHSPIGKYLPDIQRENAELHFVSEQLNKGEKVVQTHFSVTLLAPQEDINFCEAKLLNVFIAREWKLEKNTFFHLPVLLSQLPMMWGENYVHDLLHLQKIKTTLSTEACNLLPLQGEWKGTPTPGMLLAGRRGQIMSWYPFDNMSGNYNVCVVGRSGSGKSVFMQELMTSTLGLGGRVFVLDVGRSFEKTCDLLGGQFIAFSPEKPVNLNPFGAIAMGTRDAEADMLAMLKSVLFLMASPRDNLSDKGAALIEQAMCEVWRVYQNKATITHVAEWLKQCPDDTAHDMAQMLFPYTEHGPYGKYFHGSADCRSMDSRSSESLKFDQPLVVLEMEELKERKDLQAVVVQMVIIHITHQMFCGDRSTPFHIVLDEAWDLLRGKQSGVFIETLARRLRKYRGSLVVGTQSINDFFVNAGAQAAFDNSDWMCLLSQKPESIEQLKKTDRLSLSPQKEVLLKSVRTRQGQYAEVMINGADGYAIGRLLLDPFSQLLYSTQAADYTAIQRLIQAGMTTHQALEHLLKERGEL